MSRRINWRSLMNRLEETISGFQLDSSGARRESVLELLRNYTSNDDDFKRYVHFDHSGYTKNLVKDIGRGDCNVIVMCWAPRQESAYHAHENSRCFVKVLSGQLLEQQVEYPNESSPRAAFAVSRLLNRDDVCYIDDSIGAHKVTNLSDSLPAITLHIYSPPYTKCRVFSPVHVEPKENKLTLSIDESQVVEVSFASRFGEKL